jgi:hypothetical protein
MHSRTVPVATGAPATTTRPATIWREDLITVGLSAWLMIGLFVDGWAHNERGGLETFFTPWHALFYSGFTATGLWILRLVTMRIRDGRTWRDAVPAGYGLGLAGLGVFAVGGGTDLVWHSVLGIELSVDALLSPPHLLLFTGAALIIGSPLRAGWARMERAPALERFLPVLLSAALLTALVSFFFMYINAYFSWEPTREYAEWIAGMPAVAAGYYDFVGQGQVMGVASILITNLIVTGPLLYLIRRWRLPFGSATLLVVVVATLTSALSAFDQPLLLVGALVGGMLVDLLILRLDPAPERRRAFLLTGGLVPLAIWAPHLAAVAIGKGIAWPIELWFGVVVMAALGGLALALLMAPAPVPADAG